MSLSLDINNISKNDNEFSFLSTIFDLVGNRNFINDYSNRVSAMNNIDNDRTDIWLSLSAIGQLIGGVFLANINNFIDNLLNIDTCGTKGLESLANILGTNYNVFNTIHALPEEIVLLIDILSIQKEYLIHTSLLKQKLVDQIREMCKDVDISSTIAQISTINASRRDYLSNDTAISDDWYSSNGSYELLSTNILSSEIVDNAISNTYSGFIYSKLCATYNDVPLTLIYVDLSNSIMLSNFTLPNAYIDNVLKLKLQYGISKKFDVEHEADCIDDGLSTYDDYSLLEKKLLDYEYRRRTDPYNSIELYTRYKYYKQKEVKKYFDFITYEQNFLSAIYSNSENYDVDNKYFVLNLENNKNLLFLDSYGNLRLNTSLVDNVVEKLIYITDSVRDVRLMLKFFCQKNFMKGTFLLISYLINEYLKSNTYYNIRNLAKNNIIVGKKATDIKYNPALNYSEIIQYVDPVNYFNISTIVDQTTTIDPESLDLNARYWESDAVVKQIGKIDTTNIFEIPPTINSNSFAFTIADLSAFYCDMLNMRFSNYKLRNLSSMSLIDHLTKFLANIFDVGADMTYKNNDGLVITIDDMRLSSYKEDLYYRYSANANSENPFYYYCNTIHPSYQIHPSLSTYLEIADYVYPIENLASLAKEEIIDLVKKNIDDYIDDHGYLINAWKNPLIANQDYMSRYESSNNLNQWLALDPVVSYDGLFYLPAVDQISDADGLKTVIQMLNDNNNPLSVEYKGKTYINYYYGVDMTDADKQKTITQLSSMQNLIVKEAKNDDDHIIYKYGLDMFSNAYILVKDKKADHKEQANASGTLWIRYKNQPIAFPAYVYDSLYTKNNNKLALLFEIVESDTFVIDTNNVITNCASRHYISYSFDGKSIRKYFPNITDFYIASDKQDILLNFKYDANADAENVAIGMAIKKYDINTKQNLLQINRLNYDVSPLDECLIVNTDKDTKFGCYYNTNDNPGVLFYNIDASTYKTIHIIAAYFGTLNDRPQFVKLAKKKIELDCKIADVDVDICIDAINDNRFSISYIGDSTLTAVKSYFGNEFNYSDNDNKYAKSLTMTLDKCIVSKDFDIYNTIIEKNYTTEDYDMLASQFFNCFTDVGFFGIFEQNDAKTIDNSIANTKMSYELDTRGILKFLLLGDAKAKCIKFKLCLPIVMQERYASELTTTLDDGYIYASYKKAHFLEDQVAATKSLDQSYSIDDYWNPVEVNKLLNGKRTTLKVNEDYFKLMNRVSDIENERIHRLYSDTVIGPYLFVGEEKEDVDGNKYIDRTLPNSYYNPGYDETLDGGTDTYFMRFNDDVSEISISWHKNSNTEGDILLDFNTMYYNEQPSYDEESKCTNYFNEKRLFLNLTKAGAAGYLNTYNAKGDYEASYYIKNISDQHPKFIVALTADIFVNYSYLGGEGDNTINIVQLTYKESETVDGNYILVK